MVLEFEDESIVFKGETGTLLVLCEDCDPLEDAACRVGGLLMLSTNSLARFTMRRRGE